MQQQQKHFHQILNKQPMRVKCLHISNWFTCKHISMKYRDNTQLKCNLMLLLLIATLS